jgi:hypothetical protein
MAGTPPCTVLGKGLDLAVRASAHRHRRRPRFVQVWSITVV